MAHRHKEPSSSYQRVPATKKHSHKHTKTHTHRSSYTTCRWFYDVLCLIFVGVALAWLVVVVVRSIIDNKNYHSHRDYLHGIGDGTGSGDDSSYTYTTIAGIAVTPLAYSRQVPLTSSGSYSVDEPLLAPSMGVMTWDSFHFNVTETQIYALANAMIQNQLVDAGYRLVMIDDHWFVQPSPSASYDSSATITSLNQYGMQLPDPTKFPNGLGSIAEWLHIRGMQLGVHLIAGIPAVSVTTPHTFPGSTQTTAQIVQGVNTQCSWSTPKYNYLDPTNPNAQIWLNLYFELLASWGIDYVKVDCLFGWNYDSIVNNIAMIEMYHIAAASASRPILVSLSPGASYQYTTSVSSTNQFNVASHRVHSARVIVDFWPQGTISGQSGDTLPLFNQTTDMNQWSMQWVLGGYLPLLSSYAGTPVPDSVPAQLFFPDLDSFPFGGPISLNNHWYQNSVDSILTYDQQRLIMTVWSMMRSPLFIGGDLRYPDYSSLAILTNPELISINTYSGNSTVLWQDSTVPATLNYYCNRVDQGLHWILATNMGTSVRTAVLPTSLISKTVCDITNVWTLEVRGQQVSTTTISIAAGSFALLRYSRCS